jgi:hypothetical protein
MGEQARPKHSRASLNLIVESGLYMLSRFQKPAVREKLRDRKPSLFNVLEIFDHSVLQKHTEKVFSMN